MAKAVGKKSNTTSRAPRAAKAPMTTRENLSSLIGTARKILRKDKGLNGDVDRLPLLTWVMFLKFLDDLERVYEQEATFCADNLQTSRSRRIPNRLTHLVADSSPGQKGG